MNINEASSMIYRKGYYFLFYSGNNYGTDKYAVGVARSRTLYNVWPSKNW